MLGRRPDVAENGGREGGGAACPFRILLVLFLNFPPQESTAKPTNRLPSYQTTMHGDRDERQRILRVFRGGRNGSSRPR